MVEEQVICTLLTNRQSLSEALIYDPSIFDDSKIEQLFRYIKELSHTGKNIDFSVIMSHLKKIKKYEQFGGDSYFADLMASAPCFNIKSVLKNLHEKHIRNQIKLNSQDLFKSLQSGQIDYDIFIDKILELQGDLKDKESDSINVIDMSKMPIDDIFSSNNYVPFGIPILDSTLFGMFNSNLITLAGQPSSGKTTLALQMACNQKSLFISLEMPKEELYSKILSRLTEIPTIQIETKNLADFEMKKILEAHNEIKETLDIEIITRVPSFHHMYNMIKYLVEKDGYKIAFIDYIQLVKMYEISDTNKRLEKISGDLKSLAKELNIPIVMLSQLTKEAYKPGAIPTLADLRGSGALAQDSDVVFILWNDSDGKLRFTIAKGRKYKNGTINNLKFNGKYSRFEETFI